MKLLVAQRRAEVAVHAARLGAKQMQAVELLIAHALRAPAQQLLEGGVARGADQRALEGSEGLGGMFGGDRTGAEDLPELLAVGRVGIEPLKQLRDIEGHFHRVNNGVHRLLFQGAAATIPEQRRAVAAHYQAGGIAPAALAVMAERDAAAIGKGHVGFMARGAGNLPGERQFRVVEQLFAQRCLGLAERVFRWCGGVGGQGGHFLPLHIGIYLGGRPLGDGLAVLLGDARFVVGGLFVAGGCVQSLAAQGQAEEEGGGLQNLYPTSSMNWRPTS